MSKEEIPLDLSQEIDKLNQALNITLKVKQYVNERLKAQEEKHKEEMEKFAEWLVENRWVKSVTPNFFIRIENYNDVAERVPATELIEMFKKR